MIQLKISGLVYRVINSYAPNNEYERVQFFNMITTTLSENSLDDYETIIGGDYNCVLDSELDRKNYTSNYDIGQRDIKYLMDIFDLEDIWRRRNPDKKVSRGKVELNSHELITGWYPIHLTIKLTKFP